MRLRVYKILFFILICIIYYPSNSNSQVRGSINVYAGVLSPVTINSARELNFGNEIISGVKKTVDKLSGSAGSFQISGKAGKQLSVSFSLPENLKKGTEKLPISFAVDDGCFVSSSNPNGMVFNPLALNTVYLQEDGNLGINLGGSLHPSDYQEAGTYYGSIVINLQYSGN
jgi:hypothetical protein